MEHISISNVKKAVSTIAMPAIGSSPENQFSAKLKLSEAGALLRNTAQYQKWIKFCQNNDELAVKNADILLERHEILNKANQGQAVNWTLFDTLTRKLKNIDIFLFESSDIFRRNPSLANTKFKEEEFHFVRNELFSNTFTEKLENSTEQPIEELGNTENLVSTEKPISNERPISTELNAPFSISDDNFVLINVEYKNYLLANGLAGYGNAKTLFLPLEEILIALDFSIETDGEKGTADGWFISEDRKFALDIEKKEVWVDGKKMDLPSKGIEVADGEIYVDTGLLSNWFPVDFEYDFSKQSVAIDPREKLPIQARLERKENWNQIRGYGRSSNEAVFPREESEYKWLDFPFVDVGLTSSYSKRREGGDFNNSLFLKARGDIGKMTSDFYMGINSDGEWGETRLRLDRVDPDANLLGPLNATSISAGDINATRVTGALTSTKERGVRISNKELFRSNDFDETFFQGYLPSGWDVELYRNKELIDSMRVGEDGEYNFTEIPTYYGQNNFELIFYGPQGQKRTEIKNIDIGNNVLKLGKSEYSLSLTQKDILAFEPDDIFNTKDKESPKLNATYDYGLAESVSMGAGISSQEINEIRHDVLNLNAKGNYKGVSYRGDYIQDLQGGNGVEGTARTTIGSVNLNLKQKFYDNFIDNTYSLTNIAASKIFKGNSFTPDIYASLYADATSNEGQDYRSLGGRLSTKIKGVDFSSYLRGFDRDDSLINTTGLEGGFLVNANIGKSRLEGRLDYDIKPNVEITNVEVSNTYDITDQLSSHLYLKKDLKEDKALEGVLGFNWSWNNGKYIVSPSLSYNSNNSNDELRAALTFTTSLGKNPSTKKIHASSTPLVEKGAVLVKVYHDKNNNSVFDEEDEAIKGATIKAVQGYSQEETNEEGVAFLPMSQAYRPSDIVLDKTTLEDPFFEPSKPSRSIVPRPGHIQTMEIPVVAAGEIDGTISKEKDGFEKMLSNVRVQLLDETGKVIQEVRSEYDGFYLFQKVFPGKYSVRIDPNDKRQEGLLANTIAVEIDNEGSIASGRNFFLEKETDRVAKEQILLKAEPPVIAKEPVAAIAPLAVAAQESSPTAQTIQSPVTKVEKPDAIYKKPLDVKEKSVAETLAFGKEKIQAAKIPATKYESAIKVSDELQGLPKYGLHLSSYRTPGKAAAGINYLLSKYKGIIGHSDFTIQKVNVSEEKGTWYRVIAGSSQEKEQVEKMKRQIKMLSPYCKVTTLNTDDENKVKKGVHMTSFRKRINAERSIVQLIERYPTLLKKNDFTIQDVDLGPKMGKWKRVVAGNFSDESSAAVLARKIKMKSPYAKVMEIEKTNELGIHLASYKSYAKAVNGLKILQKKYGLIIKDDDFSIRRVNLGDKKGIWYRVFAGRFEEKNSAMPIKNLLNQKNQYARVMSFSVPEIRKP